MAETGISGMGLAVATGGALLVYAGFKGVNPLAALRDVASGSPTGVASTSADLSSLTGSGGAISGDYPTAPDKGATSSPYGAQAFVSAAKKHAGEQYSQAKRWQPGFSDCSSFVGKALKDVGIKPPGGSITTDYLLSKEWRKIPPFQARAGDLAVNQAHMAIFLDSRSGIGQQNRRVNVRTGDMQTVLFGRGQTFTVLRYAGWM